MGVFRGADGAGRQRRLSQRALPGVPAMRMKPARLCQEGFHPAGPPSLLAGTAYDLAGVIVIFSWKGPTVSGPAKESETRVQESSGDKDS